MSIVTGQSETGANKNKKRQKIKIKKDRLKEIEAIQGIFGVDGWNRIWVVMKIFIKIIVVVIHTKWASLQDTSGEPGGPYTCVIGLILLMEWIDGELSHLLKNNHISIKPQDVEYTFLQFLQEDNQEEPTENDLSGVENKYLGKKDMLLMKECGFRWEAKAALAHERMEKRKKEEELEKNRKYQKWERRKNYEKKLDEIGKMTDLMNRASPSYTLNTLAEGETQIFDANADPYGVKVFSNGYRVPDDEPYDILID